MVLRVLEHNIWKYLRESLALKGNWFIYACMSLVTIYILIPVVLDDGKTVWCVILLSVVLCVLF